MREGSDYQFHRLTMEYRRAPGRPKHIPFFKTYPTSPRYPLPEPLESDLAITDVLKKRRSIRSFNAGKPLSLQQLASICYYALGITGEKYDIKLRTYPSAGALYPIELYVLVQNVDKLPEGIFHYNVLEHSLEHLVEGEFIDAFVRGTFDQDFVYDAPISLILTIYYERTRYKYGYRAYRYVFIDLGAVVQNVYLVSTGLRLGAVVIGAFNDEFIANLIGLDIDDEFVAAIMPVGYPI